MIRHAESPKFALNGVDRFMLGLDSLVRKLGSNNTCHMELALAQPVTRAELELRLADVLGLPAISSRRVRGMLSPSWNRCGPEVLDIRCAATLHEAIREVSIDPRHESPIRFTVLSDTPNRVLLSWHHSLTDAHGAELLLEAIVDGEIPICDTPVTSPFSKWCTGRRFARHLFSINQTPASRLHSHERRASGTAVHRRIVVSAQHFSALCRSCSLELFPSLVALAAACRGVWSMAKMSGQQPGALYIPVPHDLRRRAKRETWSGNRVTFLFFMVPYSDNKSLKDVAHELLEQMHSTFEAELHVAAVEFFNGVRWLPDKLYTELLMKPARGSLATFYFSDLGARATKTLRLGDILIQSVSHYPPNVVPPGLTIVNQTGLDGREFLLVTDSGLYSERDRDELEYGMKSALGISEGEHARDAM